MNVPAYGTSDQSVTETSVFLFCWQITTTLGCPIKDLVLPNSEHNSSTKIKTAGCRARKLPIAISSGRAHRQCGNATWYVHIYGPHPHIGLRSLSPGKGSPLMFTYYEYRKKALRYGELAKAAPAAKQESEFRALEERGSCASQTTKNGSPAITVRMFPPRTLINWSSPSPSKRNTSCGVLARR
jgi:hypothetical protein